MKIAIIIYSVSWLILLAIYLYRRKESTFNWKESDSVEKLAHPTNPVECCADANPKTMLPNDT